MDKVKGLFLPILFLFLIMQVSDAQNRWSLQKCISQAQENSIAVKLKKLTIQQAEINAVRALHNQYPNLSSSINYGLNFGRTIDPTTNLFESQSISNNRINLSTGMPLYNGGAIKNSIAQTKIDVQSSKLDADQYAQDLALSVVQYYIAILFAQDRLDNARIQVQTTTEQLNQVDKLISAGSRPEGDRLDILAQQARDEQNVIVYQNNVTTNKLSLKQLLRLPLEQPFDIERPSPDALQPSIQDQDILAVYNYALNNRFDIKSGELKIKSAEMGVQIQKAFYLPSLSFFGSLSTSYSNLGQKITGYKTKSSPLDVVFNGQNAHLEVLNEVPVTAKNPYFSQIDQNLGYGFGFGLSIPIYENYKYRAQVKQAQLSVENTRLNNDQIKENLKNNIQTSLNDLRATANTYEAAKKTTAAQRLAYNNTKTKFDLGSANTFELLTAKNKLDISITDELIARYDYIFRSKVIDYYLGRTITLN